MDSLIKFCKDTFDGLETDMVLDVRTIRFFHRSPWLALIARHTGRCSTSRILVASFSGKCVFQKDGRSHTSRMGESSLAHPGRRGGLAAPARLLEADTAGTRVSHLSLSSKKCSTHLVYISHWARSVISLVYN